ncbi:MULTISPECIES: hypothetical protein [Pseudomonas]|uniref:SMODS and SLOG-associating 2TM effector domain-containing protein n=1 Tax=Pseudomonas orientalis TaxID=76758 RepID=A0A4Q7CUC2_9PSED|nr:MULTISPECIES: hypothetical protein [Pseudomonas]RZI29503.1 hypothetical protein EUX57_22665 [Pseudomonas orientalis]CRM51508.1 hypothetical protein [Pseudomonas sp. 24 E 13]
MAATTTELADRWYTTQFSVRRSIRYHQRRRAFYDRLDKLSNMLSLIFGSAAIYGVLEENAKSVALVSSAIVTIVSSINLVVGSAQRGRDHTDFMRKYVELEKSMLGVECEDRLLQVQTERLNIEAEEPPVMHVLNAMCHNEMMRAMGFKKKELPKIGFFQALLAQLFDFRESSIQNPKTKSKTT